MTGGFATAYGDPLVSSERFLPSGRPSPKSSGAFVKAGTMHTARGRHTATTVNRKAILIAGGYDGAHPLASAEIYDVGRQTFNKVGSMQTARYRHTATPLTDGSVLVVGGEDANGALATAELFHLSTPLSRLDAGQLAANPASLG
jgi:hypothetical protein